MSAIWTIARKELGTYFTSAVAYVVIGAFLAIMGFMFFFNLQFFDQQVMQYMAHGKPPSLTEGVVKPVYGNMNVWLLFLAPAMTMRLFAEEKKNQTLQLLMTSPLTTTQLLMGKFVAAFLMFCVMLGLTVIYPIILFATGNPDPGPIVTCYLGTLFMGGCYISVGLLFSAMTENQIVSYCLTVATLFLFWLISWPASSAGPVWGDLFNYLSLIQHYTNFSQGLIITTDIVFYLSFIGLALFLTQRVLDSFRWR